MPPGDAGSAPQFILYLDGAEYGRALRQLTLWVHHVLLPVYGGEVTSSSLWCSTWWEHPEAIARLHGLWLAWGDLTGPGSDTSGPAVWHRDHLGPVMQTLRSPEGTFAGCKPGSHRRGDPFPIGEADPFAPGPPIREG
ncbi:DUF4913 domain-containing protein [Streptomyces sp. NPDC059906]|uniref:DUF4913 domain-containing protein n=1 Tax=Streptomyces sp. NPDC059906 TaxID=3346997 RepID=UPI00365586C1